MTRALFRSATAGLCLMSLLASISTCWLWWRSYRTVDRLSHSFRGIRYTLSSSAGRFTLFAPPPPSPSEKTRREVADLVARLRNDQLEWLGDFDGTHSLLRGRVECRMGTPAEAIRFESSPLTRSGRYWMPWETPTSSSPPTSCYRSD